MAVWGVFYMKSGLKHMAIYLFEYSVNGSVENYYKFNLKKMID